MSDSNPIPGGPGGQQFPVTHWSVVLTARGELTAEAAEALESLCRAYWHPIYGFIRRSGRTPEDAQDLTQGFFARLIEKNHLSQADRNRGRFRSFLLGSLKHFLSDEWDRSRALKRGGGFEFVSVDEEGAEARFQLEAADNMTAERKFDRRWALAVMERGLQRLEEEHAAQGRRHVFQGLRAALAGGRDARFAEAATRLGMTEGAAKMTVQRMRRRYRELLREEVGHTVESGEEIEDELRYLLELVSEG